MCVLTSSLRLFIVHTSHVGIRSLFAYELSSGRCVLRQAHGLHAAIIAVNGTTVAGIAYSCVDGGESSAIAMFHLIVVDKYL